MLDDAGGEGAWAQGVRGFDVSYWHREWTFRGRFLPGSIQLKRFKLRGKRRWENDSLARAVAGVDYGRVGGTSRQADLLAQELNRLDNDTL